MTDLISVIVPVYNAEKSIALTLNSILNQTYNNLEILIIDDGSTDNTAKVIESIKDPRIVYVLQANQGPACAKNKGIQKASGSWTIFVDADDLIEERAIETLHAFAVEKKSDLVVYSYSRVNSEHKLIDRVNVSNTQIDKMFTAAWNKFYKTIIVKKLKFPENTYFEDVAFSAMATLAASNISSLNEYLYLYTQHTNSLTKQNWLPVRHEDIIADFEYMFNFFNENKILLSRERDKEIKILINNVIFSHVYQIAISKNKFVLKKESINKLMRYQLHVNQGDKILYTTNKILDFKDKILMFFARYKMYFFVKVVGSFSNKLRGK